MEEPTMKYQIVEHKPDGSEQVVLTLAPTPDPGADFAVSVLESIIEQAPADSQSNYTIRTVA